jgi:hypothetical protein
VRYSFVGRSTLVLLFGLMSGIPAIAGVDVNISTFGAKCDGVTDDTQAIQVAARYAKTNKLPLFIAAGDCKVTASIDLSNGPLGWRVSGGGKRTSKVRGILSKGLPILDFSGSQQVHVSDLMVEGDPVGQQSAGMLFARIALTGQGDNFYLENVQVQGRFSKAAVANVNADLGTIVHSDLYSTGISYFVGCSDLLGVSSGYQSLVSPSSGCTLNRITGSTLIPQDGSCVLFADGASLDVDSTYCSMLGKSTAFVRTAGQGGLNVYLRNSRAESSGLASNTYVLDVSNTGSTGGEVTGNYSIKGSTGDINIGTKNLAGYYINIRSTNPAANLIDGSGSVYNSIILNPQGLPLRLGQESSGNLILQLGGRAQSLSPAANIYVLGNRVLHEPGQK